MPDHDYGKITKGNEDSEYFTIGNKRVNGMDIEVVYCKDCEQEEGENHNEWCRVPTILELKDRVKGLEKDNFVIRLKADDILHAHSHSFVAAKWGKENLPTIAPAFPTVTMPRERFAEFADRYSIMGVFIGDVLNNHDWSIWDLIEYEKQRRR